MIESINPLTVLIATVAAMALGFFWYSKPVFGILWMQETGITQKEAESGMGKAFGTGIVATLIQASVLSVLLGYIDPGTLKEACTYGAVVWAATMLPGELHGVAWEKRSSKLLLINAGNGLVTILLMVSIIWKLG